MKNAIIPKHDWDLIQALMHDIQYHDILYYKHDKPIITDREYDKLIEEFYYFKSKYPWIELSLGVKGGKIAHRYPMLSLANSYAIDEAFEKMSKVRNDDIVIAEYKGDGLAIELCYLDGILSMASTRGDGVYGDDITKNVKRIPSVPDQIGVDGLVTVYGEVVVKLVEFHRIQTDRKRKGESKYSSPRNAAAGIVRNANSPYTEELTFMPYTTYAKGVTSHLGSYAYLKKIGFPYAAFLYKEQFTDLTLEQCQALADSMAKERNDLDIDIDGIVFKLNSYTARDNVGNSRRHPKWSFAYKFPAHSKLTKLNGVDYSLGKTGIITPVALIEPIKLLGKTMTRASLANFNKIAEKDIKIGDHIYVSLAMDVIPFVEAVEESKRTGEEDPIPIIDKCPSCNQPTEFQQEEGTLRCVNKACKGKLIKTITHLCSRHVLYIKGLGTKSIEILVNAGILNSISDIYTLHTYEEQMIGFFGEKRTSKILTRIANTRELTLMQFVQMFSIPNLSTAIADNVAKTALSVEALLNNFNDIFTNKLGEIPTDVRKELILILGNEGRGLFDRLKALGVTIRDTIITPHLTHFNVAITGSLENMSRKEMIAFIEEKGGIVYPRLSRKVNFLITGKKPGSKLTKAKELDIIILTEDEFMSEIDGIIAKWHN